MKIFISHSSTFDYQNELYLPIQQADYFKDHQFVFPKLQEREESTRDEIESCDIVIAEVSFASTGSGIELGWANCFHKPIICIFKDGARPSEALSQVSSKLLMYTSQENMIEDIRGVLQQYA